MSIKFSSFRSLLKYTDTFEKENAEFINKIETNLQEKLIETSIEDYDCDIKLLFIQTGGSEGIFLKNLDKLQSPFYLLTNGGNNSLAASLEILTYARLHGYVGEVLHGDSSYIAKRISCIVENNRIKKELSTMTLGVLGEPSDWLISSIPDENKLKERLGINLKYLPLEAVENGINTTDTHLDKSLEFDKANSVFVNIKELVEKHNLSGLTIRCFDLLSSIKMTGCLALAKLNQEGIVSACEGDITALISMILVKTIFNQSSFQANPSRIDTTKNEIVFAHCTIPLDMVSKYDYDTHFESGIGVAIKGTMRTEDVTVFRLSSSLEEYTILEGQIVDNLNEPNLCRTQVRIKCLDDVSVLLKKPCGNHHIIFYGHHRERLENVLKSLLLNN